MQTLARSPSSGHTDFAMPASVPIAITADALSDDIRSAVRAACSSGFDGLLFDLSGGGAPLLDLSDTGQREVRHLLAAANQALVGLALSLPPKALRPESDLDQVLARIERAMRAARGLGAQTLCVDVGLLPPPPPTQPAPPRPKITPEQAGLILIPEITPPEPPRPTPTADPAFIDSAESILRELCARADRYSVLISLGSQLSGMPALAHLLKRLDCPWFGIDLDPAAVLEDDWSLDEVFDHVGTLVRHVRGRDALRGTDRRTRPAPIGQGDINWAALLANLDAAGYTGFITVDPTALSDRRAAALSALAHLRPAP